MSLSNWENDQSILLKVKQQPRTVGEIRVSKTVVRDMARLTLDRLEHDDVVQVTIELPNGSQVVIKDGRK